ncbi:MAG: hypothetical protein JST62_06495, partial [Bacteroidetes bacterium]|nr:hypothetical protein [Bacteroidota bacterium]
MQQKIDITTDEKEHRTANIGFAKWRVKCFYDSLMQGSSSVFQMNICAENPPLRKAENRCASFYMPPKNIQMKLSEFLRTIEEMPLPNHSFIIKKE